MADALSTVYGKNGNRGGAFILPHNQAVGIFANGLANQQERQRLIDAAAAKRQQDLLEANSKTIGSLKLEDHWGERAAELQKDYDNLTQYALSATQKGQDINTDRDFLSKKNALMAKAAATKDMQKAYELSYNELGKNPDSYENGLEVLKSIRGASIEDFMSGKFKPENLKRIYTLADAVKESGGTTSYVKANDGFTDTTQVDRSKNVGQAIASLDTNPAKYIIAKAGGDPNNYKTGFPTITKEGKTYYNTQGKDFEDAVINKLATDPNFPSYLQNKGYDVSTTDNIRKAAFDFAKKQNEATGTYVKQYADNLENKGTTDTTKVFTAEANQRARESNAREATRFNERNTTTDVDGIYRQTWVDNMWDGVEGSGEKLKGIVSAKPGYTKGLGIDVKGNKVTFIIPDRTVTSTDAYGLVTTKTIPGRQVAIDRSNPQDKSKLNQLVSELTGENVSESKFQTGNAGGKVKTTAPTPAKPTPAPAVTKTLPPNAPRSITRADLAKKASSSGYSVAEYEKLLKERGVTIK